MRVRRDLSAALAAAAALALAACGGAARRPAAAPATPAAPAPEAGTPAPPAIPPAEPFRSQPPPSGTPRPFEQPEVQRFTLANGIEVYLVERHELPTVALDLVFEGGAIGDPRGKEGLADTCMDLLDEGTDQLDKIAFEEALADLASQVGADADTDQQRVSLRSLTRNLDATLDLWAATLRRPGLRKADFDRLVRQNLVGLQQIKASPAALSRRLLRTIAWGPRHNYGRIATDASYRKITLADCRRHARTLKPGGAKLFALGDVTRAQIEEKVLPRLAGWKGKGRRPARPRPPAPRPGRIFFIDVPGAVQSVVSLSHPGPRRDAPDYFATFLANQILGGGFTSRINMNLREAKGWAYGAYSGFSYRRHASVFVAGASVRADATIGSLVELHKELRQILDGQVQAEEVKREQANAVLALPSRFATAGDTLAVVQELVYYGLPLDYFDTYVQKVQAVTADQIERAADQHLKPAVARLFVVGDGATILPQLRELLAKKTLGKGELVVLDFDGRVVRTPAAPATGAR